MSRRITVDENGLVVAVESVPERTDSALSKGPKRKRRPAPKFTWNPDKGSLSAADFSAAGLARRRAMKNVRRTKAKSTQKAKAVARVRKQAEELRAVEHLTDFGEAYALGVDASKGSSPNYPLAIAAFSKAYRLDPRRKVKPGKKPDTGLFEVPTRLAAAYRLNKQPYQAQKMYEWVLEKNAVESKSGAGQYFTPRSLVDSIIELVKPYSSEVIQDPAAGTGGFFVSADRYIRASSQGDECKAPPTYQGVEIVKDTHRLCLMNLFVHSVSANLMHGDALSEDHRRLDPADVIVTNPPFGARGEEYHRDALTSPIPP